MIVACCLLNNFECSNNILVRIKKSRENYKIISNNGQIWGEILKAEVIKRGEKGGVLVVRPDSGDPPEVVVKVSVH